MAKRSNKSWPRDIAEMHKKFGVNDRKKSMSESEKALWLDLRVRMQAEELEELQDAVRDNDAEGVVDALVDTLVFAVGTLDILGVDANKAWDVVMDANMAKSPGVKPGRPNPLGLPDLIKPEDWVEPTHEDNLGNTKEFLCKSSSTNDSSNTENPKCCNTISVDAQIGNFVWQSIANFWSGRK